MNQKPETRNRKPSPRIPRLAISVLLVLTLAVPLAYVAAPHVHRWRMLNAITAEDLGRRERALNYVIRHAATDEAVRQGAIGRLDEVDDPQTFAQLVNALDLAGVWRRERVPDTAWLRWLAMLVDDVDAEARVLAAQELGELPALADDARLPAALRPLLEDAEADVRYNALVSAAALYAVADDASVYESLIATRTDDGEPVIARHAWIMLGLIDPVFGYEARWRDAPPAVAEAILWASLRTNPQHPTPALEALSDPTVPAPVRAMAAYALHHSADPTAAQALRAVIERRPLLSRDDPASLVLMWRAVLAAPADEATLSAIDRLLDDLEDVPAEERAYFEPLVAACLYRTPPTLRANVHDLWGLLEQPETVALALAAIEGLPVGEHDLPVERHHPAMLRLAAFAVEREPDVELIRDLYWESESALRDLACVVAVDRLSGEALDALIASLIVDAHDLNKMSGAVLAGLTGRHTDLLRQRMAGEDVWAVQMMMRVGLWMAGEEAAADLSADDVRRLLARDDLPRTTLLLALLHRAEPAAIEELFAPRGEPALDLVMLFDQARWWHVARRYLPEDAPPFWVWADPALADFQVQVLRDWALLE